MCLWQKGHVPITKTHTMKGKHVAITNMSSLTNMACADITTQDDSRDPFRQCNRALGCMYLDHSQSIQQYSRRITVIFIMLFVSRKDRFFKKISGMFSWGGRRERWMPGWQSITLRLVGFNLATGTPRLIPIVWAGNRSVHTVGRGKNGKNGVF